MKKLVEAGLKVRSVFEFRPEDYGCEFWRQYRGEKLKPRITVYQDSTGKFLLALKINGVAFPRWKAIAALVKYCCMVERTNTGNIKSLQQAFYEYGLKIDEFEEAIFGKGMEHE
jgi:hypothetical protein